MRLSHPIKVIYVGLLLGLWTSCTDDGGTTPTGCVNNEGCLEGYECHGDGLCYENAIVDDVFCIDNDGDGYGVGTIKARQKCPLCERLGLCGEDCDDNDKTRSPDGGEGCNGRDDNCNGEIDEPTPCNSAPDCQALTPYIPANTSVTCEDQQCVVKMDTQLCFNGANPCPCNAEPVACEASSYATVPATSECL